MSDEKKPSLAVVISQSRKSRGGDDSESDRPSESDLELGDDGDDDESSAAIDELYEASQRGDRQAFVEAFRAAVLSVR
ncbi:MAG: hypothetical protein FWD69_10135 [Polyangiaceae bacterium]|nr:hypothetical protein [Polyangiaceae bacterium]